MTRINYKNLRRLADLAHRYPVVREAITDDGLRLLDAVNRPWYVRLWRWLRPAALSVPVAADVRISPASAFWLQNPHLAPVKIGDLVYDRTQIGQVSDIDWSNPDAPAFKVTWGGRVVAWYDATTVNDLHFAYLDLTGW